jgi:hypothetical protein
MASCDNLEGEFMMQSGRVLRHDVKLVKNSDQ